MKKLLLLSFGSLLLLSSCGPAAEDREKMHARAKVIADSIALVLKTSMDVAAQPGPARAPVATDTSTTSKKPN